jgi:hypothetical protein
MRALIYILALATPVLVGCGSDQQGGAGLEGTWRGLTASGLAVSMEVESTGPGGTPSVSSVLGILTVDDDRCLRSVAMAGVLTKDVLEVSAAGSGRVARLTFVDVSGVVEGDRIESQLSMTSDRTIDSCEIDRSQLTLVRQ